MRDTDFDVPTLLTVWIKKCDGCNYALALKSCKNVFMGKNTLYFLTKNEGKMCMRGYWCVDVFVVYVCACFLYECAYDWMPAYLCMCTLCV